MTSVEEFVLKYIQKNYTVPADIDIYSLNYVEQGYIDSLGFIKFIVELEEEFGFEFTDDELSAPAIQVVGELIGFVESKIAQR
ncbi:MAG: phosphopantetheine-binding protein [Firmicutes bacterium]|nr:phosphopantetheine-binding protein [Bacillota bacterium]